VRPRELPLARRTRLSQEEYDAVDPHWRHRLLWPRGAMARIKRQINRRFRHIEKIIVGKDLDLN